MHSTTVEMSKPEGSGDNPGDNPREDLSIWSLRVDTDSYQSNHMLDSTTMVAYATYHIFHQTAFQTLLAPCKPNIVLGTWLVFRSRSRKGNIYGMLKSSLFPKLPTISLIRFSTFATYSFQQRISLPGLSFAIIHTKTYSFYITLKLIKTRSLH